MTLISYNYQNYTKTLQELDTDSRLFKLFERKFILDLFLVITKIRWQFKVVCLTFVLLNFVRGTDCVIEFLSRIEDYCIIHYVQLMIVIVWRKAFLLKYIGLPIPFKKNHLSLTLVRLLVKWSL